jgi:hypothetical protein
MIRGTVMSFRDATRRFMENHPTLLKIIDVLWWVMMIWWTYDMLFKKGPFRYKGPQP